MSIVSRTLSDQAFDVVRERILTGAIPPLAPIRQEALAEELGISKIPLREALGRLEQHGLIASHPNRGFHVSPLSRAEAEEVFALRAKIEPDAAALASRNADEEDRQSARAALAALEECSARADPAETAILNRDFHLSMIRPCRQRLTTQLVERLHVLSERYARKHLEPEGREDRALHEHRALLDAWLQRDIPLLTELTAGHILSAIEDLRVQLHGEEQRQAASDVAAAGTARRGARK